MFLLTEVNSIPKIRDYKQKLIWPNGSSSGKVVIIMLKEVITLHMGPIAIDIKRLSLKFIPGE